MKQVAFLFLALIFSCSLYAGASGGNDPKAEFTYDKKKVQEALNSVDLTFALDTISKKAKKEESTKTFDFVGLNAYQTGLAGGILSVITGCLSGPAAIAFVYLDTDNNKAEVKEAVKGCVIGGAAATLVAVGAYFVFVIAVAGGSGFCCYMGY